MRQNVVSPSDARVSGADGAFPARNLESAARKLADITRKAPRERELEAIVAAASAEHERRAREAADKTAAVLDSVSHWVERTEGRLSETARLATESQERTASMLSDALGLMTRRLNEIERKITETQQQAMADEREGHSRQVETSLRGIEQRIALVTERIAQGPQRGRGKLEQRAESADTRNEVFSRRSEPEDVAAAELRAEIKDLRESLVGLATGQEVGAVERAVRDLAGQVSGKSDGGLTDVAGAISAVQLEMGRLADKVDSDATARAALDFDRVWRKLDTLAERSVSPGTVEHLSREIGELRSLIKDIADPNRVRNLAEQVAGLNHQVTQVRRQFGTADFTNLASTIDQIRTAVITREPEYEVVRQLERLSNRIDGALASSGSTAGIELLMERLDRLNENLARPRRDAELKPIEDMLRSLAEKVDQAVRPGADLEGLEKQIAAVSQRIERSSHPTLGSLERSMGYLLSRMDELRSSVAALAERPGEAPAGRRDTAPITLADFAPSQEELADKAAPSVARQAEADEKVRATLDTIVLDLTAVDEELAGQRREAKPAESSPHPEEAAPPAQEFAGKQLEDSLKRLEAELVPQVKASHADTERAKAAAEEEEILLEPGDARPKRQGPALSLVQNNAGSEPDIKAAFIAAARRAAQAAVEDAGATPDKATSRRSKPRRGARADRGGLNERRRPILLAAAAIVLALGALQVGVRYVERQTAPVTIAATQPEVKVAAAVAPQPPRDAGPATTAALEAPPSAEPIRSGAALSHDEVASLPGALPEPSARERQAALVEPKGAVRLDASPGKLDTAEAATAPTQAAAMVMQTAKAAPAAPFERIPDIASVQIPLQAGSPALRQAALAGDPAAVYELAVRAAEGRGMPRDLPLAARLFEKAAAHGVVPAQYRTGSLYEKGLGVTRDLAVAKAWYQRAADKGNARAMHNLAVLIAEGAGGKPDYTAAVGWFRRAAQLGVRDSQFNLAVLLARGLGAPQDLSGSYTWFAIVAAQGDEDAAKKRDEVAARLGPVELSAAKLAAERWRPEAPDKVANEITPPAQGWSEAPSPPKPPAKNGKV